MTLHGNPYILHKCNEMTKQEIRRENKGKLVLRSTDPRFLPGSELMSRIRRKSEMRG